MVSRSYDPERRIRPCRRTQLYEIWAFENGGIVAARLHLPKRLLLDEDRLPCSHADGDRGEKGLRPHGLRLRISPNDQDACLPDRCQSESCTGDAKEGDENVKAIKVEPGDESQQSMQDSIK